MQGYGPRTPGTSPTVPGAICSAGVLSRSGSLRREPSGTHQAEAALHLRRAMSCYPAPDMETMEPSSPAGEHRRWQRSAGP